MAAPTHPVTAGLQTILDVVASHTGGELADDIPQLACADPDRFGIALVSMGGHRYGVGDALVPFSIQSIAKAFVYALALADHGVDGVLERVGVEPSGEAFNAISLDDDGRPANPMVNAGALLTTSLIRAASPQERSERILACLSAFAGRDLEVDEEVRAAELEAADRNRALAYLMQSAGSLTEPVDEVLGVYCRQCAVTVTASDLAVMAATLAAGGVNPVTGDRVVDEMVATRTLAVMATCGLYDYSGEWLMRVGLPAKSGVSGGLIAAGPTEFGIGVFSPRLDERGNSVRGIAATRELSSRFDLHLMHHPGDVAPVVYHRGRHDADDEVLVVAAQGVVAFSAAERIVAAVDDETADRGARPTGIVLDLHRVTRLSEVAEGLVGALITGAVERGARVAFVRPEHLEVPMPELDASRVFDTRAEALGWLGVAD